MTDVGAPASYLTAEPGVPVLSCEGEQLGKLEHVLADQGAGIFDGIVFASPLPGGHRFADAPQVAAFHERAVVLTVESSEAERLRAPRPNPAVMEAGPDGVDESDLERKLRQAWERVSGNY